MFVVDILIAPTTCAEDREVLCVRVDHAASLKLLTGTIDATLSVLRTGEVEELIVAAYKRGEVGISRLHNPTFERTIELFRQYADVDLNGKWSWNRSDDEATRKRLNDYIKLRGDVVHRSRRIQEPHPVKKDELEKAIRFLKALVQATEVALTRPAS